MEYEQMLGRAYKLLPKENLERVRFELPPVDAIVQGPKTIFRNFDKIVKTINRDVNHILKFITKETATAAVVQEDKLILKGRFEQGSLQNIINEYMRRYVLCKECGRPDTKVTDNKGVKVLKCEACGAFAPIKE